MALEPETLKETAEKEAAAKTAALPGPEPAELEAMKKAHGKVWRMVFDKDRVFYVRTLKRQEHLQMSAAIEKVDPANRQALMDESIVRATMLWPKVDASWYSTCDAGLVYTLASYISERSGFTQLVGIDEV